MSLLGGLTQTIGGMIGGRARRNEQRAANAQMNQRMQAYESFQFENPFENLTNPAANLSTPASSLTNPAANLTNFAAGLQNTAVGAQNFASQMENTAEDLTVDQRAAQFQAQQQQQGLSNVLAGARGAAGSSGIAALAQTLAGQQSQNLQAASASIGQQEAANRRIAAQQGAQIQQAIAAESSTNQARAIQQGSQNQILAAQMAGSNQMAGVDIAQQNQILAAQQAQANQRLGAEMGFQGQLYTARGAQDAQTSDFNRQATLLGISMERKGQADQARADAKAQILGGIGTMADSAQDLAVDIVGAAAGGVVGSDKRLKQNIKLVGKSKRGFKIYTFEYKDKKYGEGTYQGVMSDEVPRENVIVNQYGYDMVNYSNLDVEFKRV
jgi:hypothetical protein